MKLEGTNPSEIIVDDPLLNTPSVPIRPLSAGGTNKMKQMAVSFQEHLIKDDWWANDERSFERNAPGEYQDSIAQAKALWEARILVAPILREKKLWIPGYQDRIPFFHTMSAFNEYNDTGLGNDNPKEIGKIAAGQAKDFILHNLVRSLEHHIVEDGRRNYHTFDGLQKLAETGVDWKTLTIYWGMKVYIGVPVRPEGPMYNNYYDIITWLMPTIERIEDEEEKTN